MEGKIALQTEYAEQIKKAQINYKKSPKDRITEVYAQVRLENLEELWTSFHSNHKGLIEHHGTKLKDHDYVLKQTYDKVEEIYLDYKTDLKSTIKIFQNKNQVNTETRKGELTAKPKQIELPKIVIPSFSGKYTEWITFRDLFVSLIHNNANLDNVHKMHYLKSYLTGEAEQLLRQLPISEANYERCWTLLKERYDNKRYLSHHILKRLLSQRNITVESASSLKELMDTTNDCLSALSNLGIDVKSWDIIIIHILTLKLDSESKKQWEFSITSKGSPDELPTFIQFKEFLTNRYRALEFLDTKSSGNRYQNSQNNHNNQTAASNVYKVKSLHVTKIQCQFCTEAHKLNSCKKFVKESVENRRQFVSSNNVCFNCLGSNHGAKVCQSNIKCKLCHRRHHTLLHPRGTDTSSELTSVKVDSEKMDGLSEKSELLCEAGKSTDGQGPLVSCFSTGSLNKQVLLATALVKIESKNNENYFLRALLDQGSQANFVTESVVQNLKLVKKPISGKISGVGGDQGFVSKAIVTIKIKSRINSNVTIPVQAFVLKSITSFLPTRKVEALEWPELAEIALADPSFGTPNRVDLLLGADVYSQVIQAGVKKGPNGTIVAQSTKLGWILSGAINSSSGHMEGVKSFHCQIQEDDDILKRFWELESDVDLTKEQKFTEEEKKCEEIFTNTTTRDEEGRYIVRLPFRDDDQECKKGDTRSIAEKRLKGLEFRLKKNIVLKEKYTEVIEEYLHMGHMEEVPESHLKTYESVYLPHHAVVREDKDTTKVRVVFNASQKGKNGISLNDNLLVGPTIQPDLRHLIMKWRTSLICLTADIVKMYRQVKVHQDDADCQRLLWRENPDREIKDYRLLRVTFGTASAPFLAVRTLQQVAIDEGSNYPLVAERISKDFYMDDLMTGCETVAEGSQIYEQMNDLLKKGGFILQKWTSNNKELLDYIKLKEKGKEINNEKENTNGKEGLKFKMDNIIKILGLTWDRNSDTVRYIVKLPTMQPPVTKRKIISDISRLFDPLGWITPCILKAKALIQKLWTTGIGWDDEVPKALLEEWNTYRVELLKLVEVQVPRWTGNKTDDIKKELHGFCDASKTAYAAVVYIRTINSQGQIKVSLITGKSKVAPIKQVSIPRLELCGAVLVTRLLREVAKVMGIGKRDIHAWTDSTIVLAWLNSHPNKWKVFVANRVSEILMSLNPNQWSHVPTSLNPADCASRGLKPTEMRDNLQWFDGPKFLTQENINYGKPKEISTDLEIAKVHHVQMESINMWDKFSSFSRLIRVIAYCRRFLNALKSAPEKKKGYLKTDELQEALEICIKECQRDNFEEEIKALKKKEELHKKSSLKTLNPFLDEKGILRVGGRLEYSQLLTKHPIVIPKKSHLTDLLITHAHKQILHGGNQLTLNYINSKYFVLGVKKLVKSHIRKCVSCVKNAGISHNQIMGQLPSVRVTPSRPFKHSGVDFAGPIQIRTTKGRGNKSYKGYICLFVCMSTRAVHIEAVTDLSTQGFLQAFKRFVARRGFCEQIWSDNGTNFVGAARELKKLFTSEKGSLQPELAETLATNGTAWHFIPPHAPNFGGLWEAGVKSVKFHLKRVIGESTLTFEEISTVLAQIEACLNSRPLTRIDSNAEDTILSPGHFLVGEPLTLAPDYNYENSQISSLRRWQYTQRMLQEFWRKWAKEYLTQFFHRYRWNKETPQPKVGDVVLVKEDGLPPARWLYGRIIEEHPGLDKVTRVVTIKTKNSVIKRPISKLCVLPVAD